MYVGVWLHCQSYGRTICVEAQLCKCFIFHPFVPTAKCLLSAPSLFKFAAVVISHGFWLPPPRRQCPKAARTTLCLRKKEECCGGSGSGSGKREEKRDGFLGTSSESATGWLYWMLHTNQNSNWSALRQIINCIPMSNPGRPTCVQLRSNIHH